MYLDIYSKLANSYMTEIDLRMHFYHEDSIYVNDKSLILQ